MSLERRLQHAARELREVDVEVPDRGLGRRRVVRRVHAAVVPVLFVVGGVAMATGGWQQSPNRIGSEDAAAVADDAFAADPAAGVDAAALAAVPDAGDIADAVPDLDQLETPAANLPDDASFDGSREVRLINAFVESVGDDAGGQADDGGGADHLVSSHLTSGPS
jgi:hypothetical protein